ncbi:hypothetical protein GCM10007394_11710 [Salinibacterium amurskyense]|nr:hypothetical protein GCM10007394_11710 [Salinibacterium amurskyense]
MGKFFDESALRISNADRKGGNRFLPIRSALLRIPVAAFGLKKYRCGGRRVSKISDDEDSTAALGDPEVSTVKNSPRHAIPELGQRSNDESEISSLVGREETRNVFDNDSFGATLFKKPSKLEEEP